MIVNSGANSTLTYVYEKALINIFDAEGNKATTDMLIASVVAVITGGFGSSDSSKT